MSGLKRWYAQEPSPWNDSHAPMRAFLAVMVSAIAFAACGLTPASPSLTPSAPAPAPSETPAPVSTPSAPTPSDASAPVPSSAEVSFEACALLSGAELTEILGAEALQPRPMPSSGWVAGQCAWNGATSGFFVSVGTAASISAFGDAAVPDAEAKLAEFKN